MTIYARDELTKLWTVRLYDDYKDILYWHRIKMETPIIRIVDYKTFWGRWNPEQNTIEISRTLITSYPWHVVLDVLKHEMAHKYVSAFYKDADRHGPYFKKACDSLGVPEWARSASGTLENNNAIDWRNDTILDTTEDRMLQRIEKLLALAESANEHEASLAMQRVQEIYARYNVDRIKDKRPAKMVYSTITRGLKKISAAEAKIFSILHEFFFVEVIYLDSFNAAKGQSIKAVEILGTRENILTSEYIYHFLWNHLELLWQEFKKSHRVSSKEKRSYQLGLLNGFSTKLKNQEIIPVEMRSQTLTIKNMDLQLNEFTKMRHPSVSRTSTSRSGVNGNTYHAGEARGKNINIHKGISRSTGNLGRFLN